jgi:hypothetical protein
MEGVWIVVGSYESATAKSAATKTLGSSGSTGKGAPTLAGTYGINLAVAMMKSAIATRGEREKFIVVVVLRNYFR